MKFVGRNIFYFLVYISFCFASENKPVATNREVLFALSDSVIAKIVVQGIKAAPSISVKISKDTITNFYRANFINGLVSNRVTVFDEANTAEKTLELSVQESSVFFGELFTDSFLGRKRTERIIKLKVHAIFSSSNDGKILWSQSFSENVIDTLYFSDIEQMNNSSIPITNYKKPELSFFDSVLEPAIVIFSTGVAVYLFFTIRS